MSSLRRLLTVIAILFFVSSCFPTEPSVETTSTPQIEEVSSPPSEPAPIPSFTPTSAPTAADCKDALIAYIAYGQMEDLKSQSGMYVACSDGTFSQLVVPTTEYPVALAVSPNTATIALATYDLNEDVASITLIDSRDYSLTRQFSPERGIGPLEWSPDGEYLAYLRPEPDEWEGYLEILHLDSQVVSQAASGLFLDFDWSPDGKHILFPIEEDPGQRARYLVNVVDIDCDLVSHTCRIDNERTVEGIAKGPSWSPDSSQIISAKAYHPDTPEIILISDLDGNILQEISITDVDPEIRSVENPIMSTDGSQIAFLASPSDATLSDIFVLDLDEMTLKNITPDSKDTVYSDMAWLSQ